MATRSAHTFENRFMNGREVTDADIIPVAGFVPDPERYSQLWTLVDPMIPSGQQYWLPGHHVVNREGFLYSEKPRLDNSQDEYRRW